MIPLGAMPVLIASHRQHLHRLTDPRAMPEQSAERRERLGAAIIRFGHWVANYRPEVLTEPTPALSRA